MACECLEKSEVTILEGVKKNNPGRDYLPVDKFRDETGFQNLCIGFNGNFLYFEYKLKYTFTKVNNEKSAVKTHKFSIYPTFCPFCDIKYEEEKED